MKKYKDIDKLPKMYTHDEVVKKVLTSKASIERYHEEVLRMRLAIEIKKLRTQQKLTQETLAEKANMPQSVIARIEGGKHTVSLVTLDKIARALGKKVSEPFFVSA